MVAMESMLVTQEEQAGGSSANYDGELIHLAEAHRDILRAGACVCVLPPLCSSTYMCICKAFLLAFILKHMISAFIVILATCMYSG